MSLSHLPDVPKVSDIKQLSRSASVPALERQSESAVERLLVHGSRTRKPTERGAMWNMDRARQHLQSAISSWRKKATKLECMLSDCDEPEFIKSARNELEAAMERVYKVFEDVEISGGADEAMQSKIEGLERENLELVKLTGRKIRQLVDDSSSIRSSQKEGSYRSGVSSAHSKASKLASLKVKLKHSVIEEQKEQELVRVRSELRSIRLQKEIELAETSLLSEHDSYQGHIAHAVQIHRTDTPVGTQHLESQFLEKPADIKLPTDMATQGSSLLSNRLYLPTSIDSSTGTPNKPSVTFVKSSVQSTLPQVEAVVTLDHSIEPLSLDQNSTPANQNWSSATPNPVNQHTSLHGLSPGQPENYPTASVGTSSGTDRALLQHLLASRLPIPEPDCFDGDALKYPAWKASFMALISHHNVSEVEKLYYLRKFVRGHAKECIDGCFLISNENSFREATALLDERFGDPFTIASAFRDKLDAWPRVPNSDGRALLRWSDFLQQCKLAMNSFPSLNVLNDDRENRYLLQKLPDWLIARWSRLVIDHKTKTHMFPTFSVFADFIRREARIACDPVTSVQAVHNTDSKRTSVDRTKKKTTFLSASRIPESKVPERARNVSYGRAHKEDARRVHDKCPLCDNRHDLNKCGEFLKKSYGDRQRFVFEKRLCFKCLGPGHMCVACQSKKTCEVCGKTHPTSLHRYVSSSGSDSSAVSARTVVHLNDSHRGTKTSMIVPVLISHRSKPSKEICVYALLDQQSDTTFIRESTLASLGVSGHCTKLMISTMSDAGKIVNTEKVTELSVRGLTSDLVIQLPTAYSRADIPADVSHIPTPEIALRWPYLRQLHDRIPPLQDAEIGLLIGYNCPKALIPREVIAPDENGPFAQRTDLGWGIIGMCNSNYSENMDSSLSHRIVTRVEEPGRSILVEPTRVKEIFGLPSDLSQDSEEIAMSIEDIKFLDIIDKGIQKVDGKYQMPLPFRHEPSLLNNRSAVVARLHNLRKRFLRDEQYRIEYCSFMNGIIRDGYAERVSTSPTSAWYLPHHGIYNHRKPSKMRVVFDCAAQYAGRSLNQELLQGPDMLNSLVGVLLRFRQNRYAFSCDIKQMFFQFLVVPDHREYLRFLWWEDGDISQEPVDYRMNVHLFGAVSSPAIANYGLKRVALDSEDEDVIGFMSKNFYVDDGLMSTDSEFAAVDLIRKTRETCAGSGLHLHKFIANSCAILEAVPPEDRAKGVKQLHQEHESPTTCVSKVLGIEWGVENDAFRFCIGLKNKPWTRRGILAHIQSIYDPLGFIAPVVLIGKRILQEMCREGADWDSPLSDYLKPAWEQWCLNLPRLSELEIPRCVQPVDFGKVKFTSLHYFSDASSSAFGQCTYLRLVDEMGKIHCSLVYSKSRVAPLKTLTIPRLELAAAVLSIQASYIVKKELSLPENCDEVFWTDSNVVLGYIRNETKRFKVFVANRVMRIRNHSKPEQWKYVPTAQNPADLASRGLSADRMVKQKTWFQGPSFLWNEKVSEFTNENMEISPSDPELQKAQTFATNGESVLPDMLSRLERFSDWNTTKRAVALCLRLKRKLRAHKLNLGEKHTLYISCTVEELQEAEKVIIQLQQKYHFSEELDMLKSLGLRGPEVSRSAVRERKVHIKKKSTLYKLDPFLDEEGLIRVGGRIAKSDLAFEESHPVVLPKAKSSHITRLVIAHSHQKVQHQGRGMTVSYIRNHGYWILGCIAAVASFIRSCVVCRKLFGKTQFQKMADLPEDRLAAVGPFSYTGVDFFGPWIIKDGRREMKRYGVVFTCLSSRAIHIESANSLDTSSFLNALRRFIATRGPIRELRSDRGTNFVGAKNELEKALTELDHAKVSRFLSKNRCDSFLFRMNPPSASHMGGVWERQIRSIRRVLNNMLTEFGSQLNDESFRTFLCEAAAIINSRPLSPDNLGDATSSPPLTPNHLLTMKTQIVLPPPGNFQREDVYCRSRWRRVQYLVSQFWTRWRKEYLQNLQNRQKWTKPQRNMEVGDIVIINDDNLHRSEWLLGRIDEIFPSDDGYVRSVKVKVGSKNLTAQGKPAQAASYLERPIHKLVLLLERVPSSHTSS